METCSNIYCQKVFNACQQGVGMGPEGQGTRMRHGDSRASSDCLSLGDDLS